MKKFFLLCSLALYGASAYAQTIENLNVVLDAAEDTTSVTTIADIVSLQERVNTQNSNAAHKSKVWGKKSFFNISYSNTKLKPEGKIELGFPDWGDGVVPEYKSDWGAALQLGHSYNLHKKPIANILQFNIDYTYIDLAANHFKSEDGIEIVKDGKKLENILYDSKNTRTVKEDGKTQNYSYIPWNLEKYDISYGMNLGPSITVAPFTYLNLPQLHFIKLNAYYHIGYQASILWLKNDVQADASYMPPSDDDYSYNGGYSDDNVKLNWSHGLTQSFGVNLSWKAIGVGFEMKKANYLYKSTDTRTYGSDTYKFKGSSSRIYLAIRF